MLSIGKMVAGAEEYYLGIVAEGKEEYYTGAGEAPGTWIGGGTATPGLSGQVGPADLRAILLGLSPNDGTPLSTRRGGSIPRVAGFDLTFSAPKSVSVLWGLSDPVTSAAVRVAHDRAVCACGSQRRLPATHSPATATASHSLNHGRPAACNGSHLARTDSSVCPSSAGVGPMRSAMG